MRLNDYQRKAESTAVYPDEYRILYPTLGLAGEAGEVADKVKKVYRDGEPSMFHKEELAKELGDVLWYISILARDLGYSLEYVAQMNIDKLEDRMSRGKIKGSGDNR
jgi:NTP pyrophosphatase (non-canonical NTP hydrolase)